jgi:hypothetical protein
MRQTFWTLLLINSNKGFEHEAASLQQCLKAELPHTTHHPVAASSPFRSNPSWEEKISEKSQKTNLNNKNGLFSVYLFFILIAIYTKQQQF